jgi:hypothetical protein
VVEPNEKEDPMMTQQLAETLVTDHRTTLLREASVRRLRRRTVRAVVRTAAPTVRTGTPPAPAPAAAPVRHLEPV